MPNETLLKISQEVDENIILKKLIEEYPVKTMLEFNEFNIGEKLQNNAYSVEQFRLIYINEKHKLFKLQTKYDEQAGIKYDYFKYKDSRDLSKVEIERYYLPKDETLIKLKRIIQLQEIRVQFFEALADSFKSQGFNIKNFLENLKIGG